MRRITVTQFLMTLSLIAIGVFFTHAEGRGERYEMIEVLAFSPDDTRIAATKLSARDALTRMKRYKENVSRTVSWLDAANGRSRGIIHQDLKLGNSGPAFDLWWVSRKSVVCNPANGQFSLAAFGGGDVICDLESENPRVISFKEPASNLAVSKSGKFLAASGADEITVLDIKANSIAMRITSQNFGFLNAARMAITGDDSRIIVSNMTGVHVWNIATSTKVLTIIEGEESSINAVSAAPDESVIVCSRNWIRRYNLSGEMVASLAERGGFACDLSADGKLFAVEQYPHVTIYDLTSNAPLRRIPITTGVTALALTSEGNNLAIGRYDGRVTLIDTLTTNPRWDVSPPARSGWPWTYPAILFAAWCFLAWILFQRSNASSLSH